MPGTILCLLLLISTSERRIDDPPPIRREFRAVWVATVGNIDWPSRPALPTETQQAEAIKILDQVAALNMNAVVLQVRPAADALYPSEIEPWSAFLTGEQGKPPEPFYDPLTFWVNEAHARGLQLHAWINPFRAKPAGAKYRNAETHVSRAHPDWVREYGGYEWMDPGLEEARDQILAVVAELAERYDIDGIHIDDYFYPYPVAKPGGGGNLEFPDDDSWRKYQDQGGKLTRADWRRENISRLVEAMYRVAHEKRPAIQVGISPFGIPRPGRPPGVVGFDQYESLYADTELWLREGWCDYWSPQLYWKIDAPGQPFVPLLNHWLGENRKGRHVWPGLSISRVNEGERGYAPSEITGQIDRIRDRMDDPGHVLFSMKALQANRRGLVDQLAAGPYAEPALVPASPWLDNKALAPPVARIDRKDGKSVLSIQPAVEERPFLHVIWLRNGQNWSQRLLASETTTVELTEETDQVWLAAIDRLGNASAPTQASR